MTNLGKTTINVHNEEMFIMPYGEFCKEQAEKQGMRFDVKEIDGTWKASGYHTNSSIDESFEETFYTEKEAELRCQEIAYNYLNNHPDYISATYYNAKEAARDLYNWGIELNELTENDLNNECTHAELEAWINEKMKEENMQPLNR